MPRKVFVAGEILTAADVNTNLMDQAVMSFAGSAARGSAIPSPVEGMVSYLNDTDALTVYNGSSWVPAASGATLGSGSILQVVTSTTSTLVTTTSTSYVTSGLTGTITPSSTASRIFIVATSTYENGSSAAETLGRLFRGTVAGTAIGSETVVGAGASSVRSGQTWTVVDSPSTTSAQTYTLGIRVTSGTGSAQFQSRPAVMTLLEVAG